MRFAVMESSAGFFGVSSAAPARMTASRPPASSRPREKWTRDRIAVVGPDQDFMKMPLRFISSACGFGENFRPSLLLIFPALIRR